MQYDSLNGQSDRHLDYLLPLPYWPLSYMHGVQNMVSGKKSDQF